MNESAVTDNIGLILQTMIFYFRVIMDREDLKLSREKQILSKDEQADGKMEFVVIEKINVANIGDILVVKVKRISLGKGLIQLSLALKSTCDVNYDRK